MNNNVQIGEHETKFVLPNCRATIVRSWLNKRLIPDPDFAEGCVSSIYFDTQHFEMLSEKLNSFYLKAKVRLRWYSSLSTAIPFPVTFLEVKNKIGSARRKKRIQMNFESNWVLAHPLEDPKYLMINGLLKKHGNLRKQTLRPAFQLDYRRMRYIDPLTGARLSLDSDIHVSRVNRCMVRGTNNRPLSHAVFEYKNKTTDLPDWLNQIIALGECRKGAFSKYSECYAHIHQTTY